MQAKIITERQVTDPLKCGKVQITGNDSSKSKLDLKKLKADGIQVMLATIQPRTLCLLICCLKT
jgi:hypothetical protein